MSHLYCNSDDMADLASSVYLASSAALGGACPALSAMPKISRNLVAYLAGLIAGLIVVNPYISGTSDTRAAGLGEAHADVVLKVLMLETDAAYTDFLDRKLVEWYAASPKSESHAPVHEDNDGEVSEAGGTGVRAECPRCLKWTNKPQQPDFEANEDRQA